MKREALCNRVKYEESPKDISCKNCSDHDAGSCMMYEAYQQGRNDVISEIRNMLEYTADKCEIKIDKDLQMIFYGIMQNIEQGVMNGAINQLKRHKNE